MFKATAFTIGWREHIHSPNELNFTRTAKDDHQVSRLPFYTILYMYVHIWTLETPLTRMPPPNQHKHIHAHSGNYIIFCPTARAHTLSQQSNIITNNREYRMLSCFGKIFYYFIKKIKKISGLRAVNNTMQMFRRFFTKYKGFSGQYTPHYLFDSKCSAHASRLQGRN